MEAPQDFKELLALLNAHEVDYLIVGAYALAFHGSPRFTGDLDILVRADKENAVRILQALDEFGFGKVGIDETDLFKPDQIIQLGVSPVRIDIITSITGVSWQEARRGRQKGRFGDLEVYYIGKQQFVTNKKAIGRKKDLADLEALGITS
jgi:hypothetical protein